MCVCVRLCISDILVKCWLVWLSIASKPICCLFVSIMTIYDSTFLWPYLVAIFFCFFLFKRFCTRFLTTRLFSTWYSELINCLLIVYSIESLCLNVKLQIFFTLRTCWFRFRTLNRSLWNGFFDRTKIFFFIIYKIMKMLAAFSWRGRKIFSMENFKMLFSDRWHSNRVS